MHSETIKILNYKNNAFQNDKKKLKLQKDFSD